MIIRRWRGSGLAVDLASIAVARVVMSVRVSDGWQRSDGSLRAGRAVGHLFVGEAGSLGRPRRDDSLVAVGEIPQRSEDRGGNRAELGEPEDVGPVFLDRRVLGVGEVGQLTRSRAGRTGFAARWRRAETWPITRWEAGCRSYWSERTQRCCSPGMAW
jgi:hypothetical protein